MYHPRDPATAAPVNTLQAVYAGKGLTLSEYTQLAQDSHCRMLDERLVRRSWQSECGSYAHQPQFEKMMGSRRAQRIPRTLEISLSQGAKWKALISTYIGTIPLSGDA